MTAQEAMARSAERRARLQQTMEQLSKALMAIAPQKQQQQQESELFSKRGASPFEEQTGTYVSPYTQSGAKKIESTELNTPENLSNITKETNTLQRNIAAKEQELGRNLTSKEKFDLARSSKETSGESTSTSTALDALQRIRTGDYELEDIDRAAQYLNENLRDDLKQEWRMKNVTVGAGGQEEIKSKQVTPQTTYNLDMYGKSSLTEDALNKWIDSNDEAFKYYESIYKSASQNQKTKNDAKRMFNEAIINTIPNQYINKAKEYLKKSGKTYSGLIN